MKYTILPLGEIGTNCAIVTDEATGKTAIIDPGADGAMLAKRIADQGLTLDYILLTHGHWDHILGVEALQKATNAPVYLHKADLALPRSMTQVPLAPTHFYDEGDTLPLGNLTITVYHTPGHTPGGVCLEIGDHLFTGDTLFDANCGRVDLPLGDWNIMLQSLARLAQMETDFAFTPGHGGGGKLHNQRRINPYVREALKCT